MDKFPNMCHHREKEKWATDFLEGFTVKVVLVQVFTVKHLFLNAEMT